MTSKPTSLVNILDEKSNPVVRACQGVLKCDEGLHALNAVFDPRLP